MSRSYSPRARALLIGLTAPAIMAIGMIWEATHLVLHHLDVPLEARHIAFEPAVLVTVVGTLLAFITIPVAIDVARATPEELNQPSIQPEAVAQVEERPSSSGVRAS